MPEKRKPTPKEAGENPEHSITLVYGEDWEGLYVDGRLYTQDHRISVTDVFDVLSSLGIKIKAEQIECDYEWLEEKGGFPTDIADVIKPD
ncbi:MAG TPA: hypothetical protein VJ227_00145 [Patescibacteria group bacterium]|nr:hypothetical protein [Patescibacteria group bacterium]